MQEDLYDEFGNYIGPEIDSESEQPQVKGNEDELGQGVKVIQGSNQHKIILHEDKKYYEDHQQMYPGAQIMIEQEDRQNIQTPIIQKKQNKFYDYYEELQMNTQLSYLLELMKNSNLIRNISVVGHLGHGKSMLMDMLVQYTHLRKPDWNLQKQYRWMDTRFDEQQRGISIKTMPISLLLPDMSHKNYVLNMLDCPGHMDMIGQVCGSLRMSEGVLLVVDVIEGVMLTTQKLIEQITRNKLDVVLVINKLDRLIIQLKIPPQDAYLKIKHCLQQVNSLFVKYASMFNNIKQYLLTPVKNNVLFAAADYNLIFSLQSMAKKYSEKYPSTDANLLSNLLWGNYYHKQGKFTTRSPIINPKRTFVQFIMEPIYKIFAHTVGKDKAQLQTMLGEHLQIYLTPQEYKMNIKSMMKLIFSRYMKESINCLVSAVVKHIRNPQSAVPLFMQVNYCGEGDKFQEAVNKGNLNGPLLINTVKMYHRADYKTFDVLGRVISGTICKGDKVNIMGENYNSSDEQDLFFGQATQLFLLQGRYRLQVSKVTAGNLVLIAGIDQFINKSATITSFSENFVGISNLQPLKFWTQPVIKVAIEPLIPNELPKMVEAIRRVNKSYLMLKTKVEQSGEHVLIGNGEMHLDCILFDIRNLYSDIQVRISDPCVIFSETVIQTSGIPCYADTPNKKNRVKALAGPLQKGISENIEKQLVNSNDKSELKLFLQQKYDWDILASGNVWAFGPQINGSNALINDTLPTPTDQNTLEELKMSIIHGFRWSTKEGPLCDEPMRNTKFRLIEVDISSKPNQRSPGQIIPTARRAFYSAFLTANPRMMEPIFQTEIHCTTSQSVDAVFSLLGKRRGAVQNQIPKVGTPHYIIKAYIPCIEALGFQTDLRVHTIGQAFCVSTFDHWETLHGDPLDKKIVMKPLEVMQPHQLARQFMVKTRRRKGLNEEVSITKYFDDQKIRKLLQNDVSFKEFI